MTFLWYLNLTTLQQKIHLHKKNPTTGYESLSRSVSNPTATKLYWLTQTHTKNVKNNTATAAKFNK